MNNAAKRVLVLVLIGGATIGAALWMREAGVFRSPRARAEQEFVVSERAHHAGDVEAAMYHMEKAVRLDPTFVGAREGLAAMYEQHKGLEAAVAEYERGIEEDRQNESHYCYRIAEMYFIHRQWEPALKWLKRADNLTPRDFYVQRLIGFCLERQGKWKEAEQHWSQMLLTHASATEAQRGLERARRHLNNGNQKGGKGG